MAEGCVNLQVLLSALAVLVGGAAAADELVLRKSLERNRPAEFEFAYRFGAALTGSVSLNIEWRDFVGRMVERSRIDFTDPRAEQWRLFRKPARRRGRDGDDQSPASRPR